MDTAEASPTEKGLRQVRRRGRFFFSLAGRTWAGAALRRRLRFFFAGGKGGGEEGVDDASMAAHLSSPSFRLPLAALLPRVSIERDNGVMVLFVVVLCVCAYVCDACCLLDAWSWVSPCLVVFVLRV